MSDALDVLDQVGKWKASGKGVAVATAPSLPFSAGFIGNSR